MGDFGLGYFDTMRVGLATALLLAMVTAGCDDGTLRARRDPPVVSVQNEDAEMGAAIVKAQSTLDQFITALAAPRPNQTFFLIKAKFTAGDAVEHIWVADLVFDGRIFRGVLANDPESIPGLSYKQPVEIQRTDVSDWMYVEDGLLVGGYTSRVLRSRMTPDEKREQDARNPYRYE